ncbi:MAG TPA: TMEM165/GDT1 family protein [Bdellovibrionota bacterium]|nr:TMEM165/GDT1 family protein [Bdellovibrionota bacterium]
MNWRLFAATFGSICIAELGDKTQLATLSLSAGGSSRWSVFAGAAAALVLSSALAVLTGVLISQYMSPVWLRRIAGAVFVGLGLMMLLRR